MIQIEYKINCTNCYRYLEDGYESELECLNAAEADGWEFRKVPNGSIWELCPKCAKLKTESLR
jgi:hypothetical protein